MATKPALASRKPLPWLRELSASPGEALAQMRGNVIQASSKTELSRSEADRQGKSHEIEQPSKAICKVSSIYV